MDRKDDGSALFLAFPRSQMLYGDFVGYQFHNIKGVFM